MSDTTVSFKIKITDEGGFKTVEFDAKKLRDAIEEVKNQADKVNSNLLNSNQLAQAFEQVTSAVQGLQSVMHGLTDTYAVQAQAETRLATVMRNTMDATDAEIQSVKDLTAAQQKLGVVGDEVQLSGAQELATYLGKKESLEKLIPVMNDMIAQQYGYNATAESAVSIATMMGKVMEGQTKALSRYGYSFTEAQEEILKFGTEEERAATLAEVIEQSVGGVNAALAATDYGKIVQANNRFGDLKESIGACIAPAMSVVDNLARFSIAIAGLGKGIATIKSLKASIEALGVQAKLTAASKRLLGRAGVLAAEGTTALRVSVIALKTAISVGITAAIYGLVQLFIALKDRTDAATRAKKDFAEASEEARTIFEEEGSKLQDLIGLIQDETAAREDQVAAIEVLKGKYPDLVAKYIDEAGHITNLIELQKELNRLRAGEKFQEDRDRLQEYQDKLEAYRHLETESKSGSNPLWFAHADKELRKDRPLWQSPEDYVSEQVRYWESMVSSQQKVVDKNKDTEWKAKLKDSTPEELNAMSRQYQAQTDWTGKPLFQQKIDDINAEIESRKEARLTQNKAYWEGIKKQKQAEYDALDKSELTSKKALALKGEIDSAKEIIALYDTESGKTKPDKKDDKAYKAAIEASEKQHREDAVKSEEKYISGNITEEEYEKQLADITIAGLEERLYIAQRYGQDETKIQQSLNQARIQQNESAYNRELKQLNECLEDEKLALSMSLDEKEITQEQYERDILESELRNANERLALALEFGKDTTDIIREQQETRLKIGEQGYNTEIKQLEDSLAKQKATLTQQLLDQKITQEQYDRLILVEMAKYYKARLSLAEAYGKAETGDTQAWLDAQLDLTKFDKSKSDEKKQKTGTPLKNAGDAWNGVKGVADSFREIESAITDTDNAWDALTKTVDGFIGVFKNVTSVIEAIKNITDITKALTEQKKQETMQTITGNTEEAASELAKAGIKVGASEMAAAAKKKEATANIAAAASGAASSVASIPLVGAIMAVAAIASVVAALSNLPKFANGGVVYGPTIGLMGEYAGASSNPEVIAPLSKLQGLLGGQQGRSEVKFRIEGRELVGILNKQNNIYQRNG